jgi:hypothetical protein
MSVDDVARKVHGLRHQIKLFMHFDPVCEDAPHLGVDLHLRVDVIAGATLAEKDMGRRPRRLWPPERCSDSKEVAWGRWSGTK